MRYYRRKNIEADKFYFFLTAFFKKEMIKTIAMIIIRNLPAIAPSDLIAVKPIFVMVFPKINMRAMAPAAKAIF